MGRQARAGETKDGTTYGLGTIGSLTDLSLGRRGSSGAVLVGSHPEWRGERRDQ
jgi:hypothetical protein